MAHDLKLRRSFSGALACFILSASLIGTLFWLFDSVLLNLGLFSRNTIETLISVGVAVWVGRSLRRVDTADCVR